MFKCAITGKVSKSGEKLTRIVVESREKVYSHRERDEDTRKVIEVFDGQGWEIVKEVNATEEGVKVWNSLTEEEKDNFEFLS